MVKRSPRHGIPNRPILVIQRAVDGAIVFPATKYYCRFLHRLGRMKSRFGCGVLAYAVLPRSIWLILVPGRRDVSKAAQALFTSAAKTLRCNDRRGRGHVFVRQFESRVLKSKFEIRQAMRQLAEEIAAETSLPAGRWPFACVNGRDDLFQICRKATDVGERGDIPGKYLYRHGRPTLRWYLTVLGALSDLVDGVLKKLV